MTAWTNPLDRVPHIRVDYANHIIYGGALGLLVTVAAHYLGASHDTGLWCGYRTVFIVAAAKKLVDRYKEGESWTVVIDKILVTTAIPGVLGALAQVGVL